MSSDVGYRKIVQYEWTEFISASSPLKGGGGLGGNTNANGGAGAISPPPPAGGGAAAGSSHSSSLPFYGGVKKEFYGGAIACGDKKVYLIGGCNPKRQCSTSQVVEFSFASKQWTRQVDLPERRSRATAVAFEDYCFLWGGWDDAQFCNSLWVLGPTSPIDNGGSSGGSHLAGTSAIGGGNASSKGNKDGAGGGGGAPPLSSASQYCWRYFPPAGTKNETPSPVPCGRIGHSLVLGHAIRNLNHHLPYTNNSNNNNIGTSATKRGHTLGPSGSAFTMGALPQNLSSTPTVPSSPSRGICAGGNQPPSFSPTGQDGKKAGGGGWGGSTGHSAALSSSPMLSSSSSPPFTAAGGGASGASATATGNATMTGQGGTASTTTGSPQGASTPNPNPSAPTPLLEPVLYLFGGFDGKRRLNDVWRLFIKPTLETNEAVWEEVIIRGGEPSGLGGLVGSGTSSPSNGGSGILHSRGGGTMTMPAPSPRDDAAVAFAFQSEKLYVFGGYDQALCNDLHALELKDGKNQWVDIPVLGPPTRRQGSIAAADENNIIVCMGCTADQQSIPQILQISIKENKWKMLAVDHCIELLSDREGYIGCCGSGNKRLVLYGGGGGGGTPFKTSIVEIELERSEPTSRRAEGELVKEDVEEQDCHHHHGGRDENETFATEPQLASAEEMKKRRIVRARPPGMAMNNSAGTRGENRPGGEEVHSGHSASAFPATGLFKSLESFSATPSAPTALTFSGNTSMMTNTTSASNNNNNNNNNPLLNNVRSNTASTDTTTSSSASSGGTASATPSASNIKLSAPTPFTFSTMATTTTHTPPPTSFGFGSSAFGSTPKNEGISLPSSSGDGVSNVKPFSFSFGSFSTAVNNTSNSTPPTTTAGAAAPPIFPPRAFSFANAASSFAEARKNAEQEQRERASKEGNNMEGGEVAGEEGGNTKADDGEADPSSGFLSAASSIASAAGEVLSLAPCKLYRFEKGGNKWVECGEGEAKLKLEKRKKKRSVATSSEVGEKKETSASRPSATGSATKEEEEEEEVPRLLVRDGYSLNAVVKKGLFLLTCDATTGAFATPQNTSENNARKHLVFVVCSAEVGPVHYLLKFTGGAAEDNAQRFTVKIKEIMEKER